eukprot:m.30904 g.30904  ORF g.30904 m.30904 type:complete len:122 (+) comp13907_c0_seq2:359-724(+)
MGSKIRWGTEITASNFVAISVGPPTIKLQSTRHQSEVMPNRKRPSLELVLGVTQIHDGSPNVTLFRIFVRSKTRLAGNVLKFLMLGVLKLLVAFHAVAAVELDRTVLLSMRCIDASCRKVG